MEFRTQVAIAKPDFEIEPLEKTLMVGSCFADNLGKRFLEERFPAIVNPDGVMYNPASVLHTVLRHDEAFDLAVITLGTNHVYVEKSSGEIVDNCAKRPQSLFDERILGVDECHDYLRRAVMRLMARNRQVKVILTVSPIRYRKYGYHESQLSKATLLLAVDRLVSESPHHVVYFPAYEIVNDELRDYRFYQPDMIHPSGQAVEYIWQRLVEVYFSDKAKAYLNEWKPVKEALAHRPFHPESKEYQDFLARAKQKEKEVLSKYSRDR